ncbi:hypothetical protein FDUTEX481_07214 [Tolypothrix sp. PCC 7601]|nr:hypothetical protein FDUTEX481_07214 [Tolypothrix sp. PCC 7601]
MGIAKSYQCPLSAGGYPSLPTRGWSFPPNTCRLRAKGEGEKGQ